MMERVDMGFDKKPTTIIIIYVMWTDNDILQSKITQRSFIWANVI